jgi:hypothetical protein
LRKIALTLLIICLVITTGGLWRELFSEEADTMEVLLSFRQQLLSDPKLVEKKVRSRLNELLNAPEELNVKFSKAEGPDKSWFDTIEIKVRNSVFDDLNIAKARFFFRDAKVEVISLFRGEKMKIEPGYRADLRIEITEADLNKFVKVKSEKIKVSNPLIKFKDGAIELTGSTKYMFAKIEFKGIGSFRIEKGNVIHFIPRKLTVNKLKMPGYVLKSIIKKINPILDMNRFPFKTVLRSIDVKDGKLVIISSCESAVDSGAEKGQKQDAEQEVEQGAETSIDKSIEQSVEKKAELSEEKNVEKSVDQSIEQTIEQSGKKNEERSSSPTGEGN